MKYLILSLLLFISASLFAQKKPQVVLSTAKTKVLYCGIENSIEVMVEGSPQRKFSVKVDSGTISKIDQYTYDVTPLKVGEMMITVIDDKGHELLTENIRVKPVPSPMAYVGNKSSGRIKLTELTGPGALNAGNRHYEPSLGQRAIIGYSVKVIRDSSTIHTITVKGNAFNEEVRNAFNNLQAHDKVVFCDIRMKELCSREVVLNSIEFILD